MPVTEQQFATSEPLEADVLEAMHLSDRLQYAIGTTLLTVLGAGDVAYMAAEGPTPAAKVLAVASAVGAAACAVGAFIKR